MSLEHFQAFASQARAAVGQVIVGQVEALDQLLLVLVCNGHALIEGAPGLAKTLLAKTLARVCSLNYGRVQCTPDLMPADVIGTNIFNFAESTFRLHRGPVFTDVLLVDEINRTSPRTQSALLEAMEERQVTIDGVRYELPANFTLLATQNPIEFEGTYPLPEAQLDRFLMKVRVSYPSAEEESQILARYGGVRGQGFFESLHVDRVEATLLGAAREEVARVRVEPSLLDYVVSVVRRTREWPTIAVGASPRASVGLLLIARATAAMDGRDFLLPDDVKTAAGPVLRHRLVMKPEAELEGIGADDAVAQVLASVPVPRILEPAQP